MATKPETSKLNPLRTLTQAMSMWMARAQLSNRAGITFGGKRDLYTALGYSRLVFPEDYRARYRRNAVAGRVVDCRAEDTWRGGAELIENDDPQTETEFEKAFEDLNKRLKIWTKLMRADKLSGIGHYSILVMGAPGFLNTPLESCTPEGLVYLTPYGEDEAHIERYETNEQNPRYGQPLFYTIRRASPALSGNNVNQAKQVHFSRVLHLADGVLDDQVFGTPRLERIWNLLDDLEKVTGGGAEAFWKRADQGMQFNIDPTVDLTEEGVTEMEAEVDEYTHGLKRVLRTRGMEVNALGSDVANFQGPASAIIEQISAGTGIPQRILMGSEQAKLAAEQDSVKYYRGIEARRGEYADPMIVRPFIDRLIELGVLPAPANYEVKWSQIRTKDDDEKLSLATKAAAVNATMGEIVVTTDEIRENYLGMDPLDESEKAPMGGAPAAPEALRSATSPIPWKQIQETADRQRRPLRMAVRSAFKRGQSKLGMNLRLALSAKSEDRVMALVSSAITTVAEALGPVLTKTLTSVVNSSGTAAADRLAKLRSASESRSAAIDFAFDKTNPKAKQWIEDHAAETIEGIGKTTRESIRDLVEQAFEEQFTVDDLAKEIGELIGDDDRADMIARTETMRASNVGQQMAWDQAVEEGLLTGRERQEWIVTPDDRLCPVCEPLDGLTAPLDGKFEVAGEQIDGPPAHPNCRCALGLSVEQE